MQKRLKNRNETREAKLEILDNSWNKLLGLIHAKNQEVADKKTYDMIVAIGSVKTEIKKAALEEYLRCA